MSAWGCLRLVRSRDAAGLVVRFGSTVEITRSTATFRAIRKYPVVAGLQILAEGGRGEQAADRRPDQGDRVHGGDRVVQGRGVQDPAAALQPGRVRLRREMVTREDHGT